LQKTEGKSLSGDNKTNRHALSLHPSAARSNVQAAYPINVELKRANEVDRSAISKLYIQMTESIADGKDAGDSAKKYFDKGIPKSYSIASARSDIVADYTGTAFLLWVKQQPKWRVAAVYMQGVNSYLVIAKSANGEVLSLMASKLPDGWKFLSGPEDNPMWPLIQTHSFLKSINNL